MKETRRVFEIGPESLPCILINGILYYGLWNGCSKAIASGIFLGESMGWRIY